MIATPSEVKSIKEKYDKKIIIAITVKDQNDIVKYLEYNGAWRDNFIRQQRL